MSDHGRTQSAEDAEQLHDLPLTLTELKTLVRAFVRFPVILKSALRVDFDPSQFHAANEQGLYFFCLVLVALRRRHDAVTKDMFMTEVLSLLEAKALNLLPPHMDFLFGENNESGFIDYAFEPGPVVSTPEALAEKQYAEAILKRFLYARLIKKQLKRIINLSTDDAPPQQFEQVITRFSKQAQAVRFVGNEAVNAAVMPSYGQPIILPPSASPTTISWIDNYIEGFRPGDVIGLLGPYSGGKTTMMCTTAVRLAQQYAATNQNKLAVYICYEDGAQKINFSLYSAAAHIERRAFIGRTADEFWANLSTRDTIKPYERLIPENINGEVILCERDRWEAVQPWFNRNFAFLDFSANPETGGRGNGGVLEVAATLENLTSQTGMEIGLVCLDYAVLMVNREMSQQASGKYQEQIWRPLQMLPDELKTHVALPFNCTVFLAHQLAQGDIKNIPPYRHVSHADAQGSKAFAENLHACLCLNKPDPEHFVSTIHWSKIRYARPASPYGLIQINEHYIDVRSVDDEYYINDLGKRIMRRGEIAPSAHGSAVVSPSAVNHEPRRRVMPNIDTFGSDLLS